MRKPKKTKNSQKKPKKDGSIHAIWVTKGTREELRDRVRVRTGQNAKS